jgi:beta-lactam-binding protein with PASTA domain
MKICPSCGRENADGVDFCQCGEYLRWEKTQYVKAVEPVASAGGAPAAPPEAELPARVIGAGVVSEATPVAEDPVADPNVTLAPGAVSAAGPSMPAVERQPAADEPPPGAATLLLRMPDDESADGGTVATAVKPGERTTLHGLIRNESGVVDNYELKVTGLPQGWWTITPAIAYLVPYGAGGNSEQEFQVQLHPPKTPDAQARPWACGVVAFSRAYGREIASAPATVDIGTYQDVGAKLAPDRASGRLKAHFKLTVSNRANAPTEVVLGAEDADGECQFRFAEPSITLNPGGIVEAPFSVFPPKQIWVGRPQDRQIRATATPAGVEEPQVPLPAVYRQRPWLPWWMAIVIPLAAVLVALFIMLQPKQTTVPKLIGAKSQFDAQKIAIQAGLKLSPQVTQTPDPAQPPGTVIDQAPKPGAKVKRGSLVSVKIATGSGKDAVPNVVGITPVAADATLRASGLALGAVSPKLDPNGKIASQIPGAGQQVPAGTPVEVFLAPPAALAGGKAGPTGAAGTGAAAGGAGAAGATAGSSAGGAGQVVVPAVSGTVLAVAQRLSKLGLAPSSAAELSPAPRATVIGTAPAAGAKVKAGSPVTVLVSAGYPQLAYDDGNAIHVTDGSTGKPTVPVPPGTGPQSQPAWSLDGTHIVYSQAGQLWLLDVSHPGTQPRDLTGPGADDHDPAFAPTNAAHVLAFIDAHNGTRLCFATVGPNPLNPDCTSHPGFTLGRQVAWSPDGTAILVFGSKTGDPATFALIEFVSNVPYSSHAADWGQGQIVTTTKPGQGVISGEFSPDGKQVALVSNLGTLDFHVFIASRTDFTMTRAEALPVRACQVSWRPDSKALAVMQADSACKEQTGDIATLSLKNPGTTTTVATQAENPAWQPLSLNG